MDVQARAVKLYGKLRTAGKNEDAAVVRALTDDRWRLAQALKALRDHHGTTDPGLIELCNRASQALDDAGFEERG